MNLLGFKNGLSRRELLKMAFAKKDLWPHIDKEKCTGCGLCATDCPTGALTFSAAEGGNLYRLLFQHDLCDACASCQRSCPEGCLHLEQEPPVEKNEEGMIIFEDEISRCRGCGIPLFPQAMIAHLEAKIFRDGEPVWSFNFCPACRIRIQIGKGMNAEIRKDKTRQS